MVSAGFRREERVGLVAALALHGVLAAVLLLRPAPKPLPLPERITVNLADVVGLTSTAPTPEAKPAPDARLQPVWVRDLAVALVRCVQDAGAPVLVSATVHDVSDLEDERTLVAATLPNHLVMPRVAATVVMGGQGSVQTAIASGCSLRAFSNCSG